MKWLPAWLGGRRSAASSSVRRSRARPSLEILEDRTLLSAVSLQTWKQTTFTVDDTVVRAPATTQAAAAVTAPANDSFGPLIGLNQVLTNTPFRGQGYSVAVIDTGINYNDPNLAGRVVAGYNFVANDSDYMDDNGHGTFVASELASSSSTYSGVAPDVDLIALKVLDSTGSGTYGNVLNALNWVVAHQAQYHIVAINLSLGSGNYTADPYTYLEPDFETLRSDGVFIAVAAGNDYYGVDSQAGLAFPAVSSNVVSVGAVWDGSFGAVAWASGARDNSTAADQICSFSQRDSSLSILAPGAIITGDALNGGTTTMAGTSMATPIITGCAVLLHEALVDDGLAADATQSYILKLMQSTGKTIVDTNNGTDNVTHTGLTFHRINIAAALAALPGQGSQQPPPTSPQPPTLGAISNQTIAAGHTLTVTLNASDPNGLALTYSATVTGSGTSQLYQLRTSLGLQYSGSYNTNLMGANEKWLLGTGATWYAILPNGQLRRWAGSWSATLQASSLVATLSTSVYTTPSLLWNAPPGGAAATATVSKGVLTVQPTAGFAGSFSVQVTVSDGTLSASQTFTVTVGSSTSTTPSLTLTAIGNKTGTAGKALTVPLSATGPSGVTLKYTAAVSAVSSLAYQLKTSLGLLASSNYNTNLMGDNEKWIDSSTGQYYCLMPDGELRKWAGNWTSTLAAAALVANLGTSYYATPSLLTNAQLITAPATVSATNGVLTITPGANFRGTFVVTVTVSDGSTTVKQSFTVTVSA